MPREALKIAILYDTWEEAGAPAAPPSDPPPPLRKGKRKPKKKEKEEREEIFDALVKLKHEPSYLILDGRDPSLASVIRSSADLFFNVTESYAGDDTKDMNIAAYLDLLGRPYTGSGPRSPLPRARQDPRQKIFAFHGIRSPYFATSFRGKTDHADEDLVSAHRQAHLRGRVGRDRCGSVVEHQGIDGRIHYIQGGVQLAGAHRGVHRGARDLRLGARQRRPGMLPLIELDLSALPEARASRAPRVKWERPKPRVSADQVGAGRESGCRHREATLRTPRSRPTARSSCETRAHRHAAQRKEVFVIEANPNPWL
jgi:D-alanine-D-alanine ligase